jgi:hypothetical protein
VPGSAELVKLNTVSIDKSSRLYVPDSLELPFLSDYAGAMIYW